VTLPKKGGVAPKELYRVTRLHRVCFLLLALSPAVLFAQAAPQNEVGKFRLHKFEQDIGEENYTIKPDGNTLTLKTDFKFTDRGTAVPLSATLRTSDSYVPQSFVISGNTSRMSKTDTEVTINGDTASIRQGKDSRTVPTPQTFFTISGYAPVAVQMEMMRYWRTHGHGNPVDGQQQQSCRAGLYGRRVRSL